MTSSDIAAWWGAGLATMLLAWDVYKWRKSRVRHRLSASAGMQHLTRPRAGQTDSNTYICIEAVNLGDKLTTITFLELRYYRCRWALVRRKPSDQGGVPEVVGVHQMPHELGPGKRWSACIDQEDIVEKTGNDGYLYVGVHHSAKRKPDFMRVNLN